MSRVFLHELAARFAQQPRGFVAAESIALVFLMGAADLGTGSELSFSIFYLIPITLVAWSLGPIWALPISGLASVTWFLADWGAGHTYANAFIPYWNAGIRLGYFVLFAYLFARLRDQLDRERTLSSLDPLTGLYNRRAFQELAGREVARAARYGRPLAVAFLDLDHFKSVNDRLGHEVGDAVLQEVAHILTSTFRSTDLVARMGGDEFAVVMPETGESDARIAVEKSRAALAQRMSENGWSMTFSIGLAAASGESGSLSDLLASADQLMYLAKRAGRDRVVVGRAEDAVAQSPD